MLVIATIPLLWLCRTTLGRMRALTRSVRLRLRNPPRAAAEEAEPALSFSLLVTARREAAVLEDNLLRLSLSDHPAFEILAVVDADDDATVAAARRAAAIRPDLITVLVDDGGDMKSGALNRAMAHCRHDVIGVFDADGWTHPGLLRAVDAHLRRTEADAIQAQNQPLRNSPRWYQSQHMVETYFMFLNEPRAVEIGLLDVRLSGNSCFVRRDALTEIGAWKPDQLAEDCDLTIRLMLAGKKLSFLPDATLATIEETPSGITAFIRQRARWNQGFIQVLLNGEWRLLPRPERRKMRNVLLANLFRAAYLPVLPLSVFAALALGPPGIVLLSSLTAAGLVNTLLTTALVHPLHDDFPFTMPKWARLRLAVTVPLFHAALMAAAMVAVLRELRGDRSWAKTTHFGLELPRGAA
ncbi:glycosyltransferase family 2 protein [Planotetraspora sp. GP83]|uniref:glycosyltransferase n=1 Tax=Planotetraspora sp. GP83 TaxID=3156264 RepID=UPI0035179E14